MGIPQFLQYKLSSTDISTPPENKLVRRPSAFAGLSTLGKFSSRGNRMSSTGTPSFTATHRVCNRVHRRAANLGPPAEMTNSSGLAPANVVMLKVSKLTDGRPALSADHSHLAARQNQLCPLGVTGNQSCDPACRPDKLTALAATHLYVMNLKPDRNLVKRQAVSNSRLGFRAGVNLL